MYQIVNVQNKEHIDLVKNLFIEYQKELGYDLCFQDFDYELKTLPGKYKQPDGHILMIRDMKSNKIAGCVALKKYKENTCEMKRLYVLPKFREKGYGKILIENILNIAQEIGYNYMILDTLNELKPALKLYRKFGFKEIKPYYNNPITGVVYMKKKLI